MVGGCDDGLLNLTKKFMSKFLITFDASAMVKILLSAVVEWPKSFLKKKVSYLFKKLIFNELSKVPQKPPQSHRIESQ